MLSGKRVLLTGASGFLGAHIGKWLMQQGARLVVTHRRRTKSAQELKQLGVVPAAWRELDLASEGVVHQSEAAVRDVDWVVHCAGLRGEGVGDAETYERVNYQGTRVLYEAAREHGVEGFVHISTVGVCGFGELQTPTTPYDWRGSHYHQSKARAELWLRRQWRSGEGVGRLLIVRPPVLYDATRSDGFLWQLQRLIARGVFMPIGAPGKSRLHMCSIPNFIAALECIVAKGDSAFPYLVGDEEALLMDEIIALVAQESKATTLPLRAPEAPLRWLGGAMKIFAASYGGRPFITPEKVDLFTRTQVLQLDDIRALGYRETLDVREGLRRTLRHLVQEAANGLSSLSQGGSVFEGGADR